MGPASEWKWSLKVVGTVVQYSVLRRKERKNPPPPTEFPTETLYHTRYLGSMRLGVVNAFHPLMEPTS